MLEVPRLPDRALLRKISRYRKSTAGTRAFLGAREAWTPYAEMAALLPASGNILDLGCGHGLFSIALAEGHPSRDVTGVDHDENRIGQANAAVGDLSNLRFQVGGFDVLEQGAFDGIALIDVLHYFQAPEHERILQLAKERLRPGGILLFREVDPRRGIFSTINRIHERTMTGLGITRGENLCFRTPDDWCSIAAGAGFDVRSIPFTRIPFADVLFTCTKRSEP